jgi:hypothetical protein
MTLHICLASGHRMNSADPWDINNLYIMTLGNSFDSTSKNE